MHTSPSSRVLPSSDRVAPRWRSRLRRLLPPAAQPPGHGPLAWLTIASGLLLALSLVLGLVDHRQVTGVSVWLKPAKFGASLLMTAPVLAWILGQMPGAGARRRHLAGTVIAVVGALELALITLQAVRGVPSHFNNATTFDAALFTTMGIAISVLWVAETTLAVAAFRRQFATPARTWAIRIGLGGALLGGAIGALMARPTPTQYTSLRTGAPTPMLGAHAVGVADGGPGLPLTHFSTEGGDLRVPHFIGLHALQALPLAAWWLERRRRRQPAPARPVIALGIAWVGLTLVTLGQALRAQPLIAPDAATLATAALVLAMAGAALLGPTRAGEPRRFARSPARS